MKAIYQNNFDRFAELFEKQMGNLSRHHSHEKTQELIHYTLGPWDDEYFSPLNHVNLYKVEDLKALTKMPFLLVRDGLSLLANFFYRFPTPKGIKTIFLIHQKLKNLVPEAWQDQVVFYDFLYDESFFEHKTFNDTLIVKGHLLNGESDLESLKKLHLKLRKEKDIKKIIFTMEQKENHLTNPRWKGDELFSHLANNFFRYAYSEISKDFSFDFINWKTFFSMQDLHRYRFVDLSEKEHLYIDDHTDFFLFKKGAKPLWNTNKKSRSADLLIPLTMSHGIRIIQKETFEKCETWKQLNELFKNLGHKPGSPLSHDAFEGLQRWRFSFL
jgi:hypothetical protein